MKPKKRMTLPTNSYSEELDAIFQNINEIIKNAENSDCANLINNNEDDSSVEDEEAVGVAS